MPSHLAEQIPTEGSRLQLLPSSRNGAEGVRLAVANLLSDWPRLIGGQPSILRKRLPADPRIVGRLRGVAEKLRSEIQGKVREAIERSISKILVDRDGTLTVETKPDGVLGLDRWFASLWCRGRESNPHGASSAGF